MAYTGAMKRAAFALWVALAAWCVDGCSSKREGTESSPASQPGTAPPQTQAEPSAAERSATAEPAETAETAETDEPDGDGADDREALLDAASDHVKASAAGVVFSVSVAAREGDFARIRVIPMKAGAERATLYMKRENGAWRALDMGTAVACETLSAAGMPDSVSKGCQ
jgi:hypothetical protein